MIGVLNSGQYGMVLLSKFPLDASTARTFQHFLWKDMPGAGEADLAAVAQRSSSLP